MGKTVLIVAGGTGGHIYPALAVADCLRSQNVELHWLGSRHGLECRVVPAHGIDLLQVLISGVRGRGMLDWLIAPFKLAVATMQAIRAILRTRPGVVLGMGGFVSGPGGLAAWLCRRPLVIHEQNAIPGLTNKLLSRIATRVLQAYPHSFDCRTQAVVTGNPVRREIANLRHPRERLQTQTALKALVFGGSRGARRLNELMPRVFARLEETPIEVWHQTGLGDRNEVAALYRGAGVTARVDAFIDDMAAAYAWADLVICRAGAITIAELAAAGVAAILVPYPYAVDDHQTANARFLSNAGAALLMPESTLTAETMTACLSELCRERERLLEMACRARDLAIVDAAATVAGHCLELMHV